MSQTNNIFGTDTDKLVCYGCAHSASGAPYPGGPSGERPCHFCLRNREPTTSALPAVWYDGTPAGCLGRMGVPGKQDNYYTIDIGDEHRRWNKIDLAEAAERAGKDPPSIVPRPEG